MRQEQRKAGGPLLWVEREKSYLHNQKREKRNTLRCPESEANPIGKNHENKGAV